MISLIIYLVMALMIVLSLGGWRKLSICRKDLDKAASVLKDKENAADLRRQFREKGEAAGSLFQDEDLRYELSNFQAEISNIEMGGGRFNNVDIADYFDSDLLDFLGNRPRCEQAAAGMTALGILGTFLGLASGLGGFRLGNSSEIISGIENLMGGMSTAFWTSIAGIIASLIYSFLYEKLYRSAEKSLDRFVDVFRKNLYDDQTDTALKTLVACVQTLGTLDRRIEGALKESVAAWMEGFVTETSSKIIAAAEQMMQEEQAFAKTISEAGESVVRMQESIQAMDGMYKKHAAQIEGIVRNYEGITDRQEQWISGLEEHMKTGNDRSEALLIEMEALSQTLAEISGQQKTILEDLRNTAANVDRQASTSARALAEYGTINTDFLIRQSQESMAALKEAGQALTAQAKANMEQISRMAGHDRNAVESGS